MIPLSDDEKVAFAALIKSLVTADDLVSPQEEARLARVVGIAGPQVFGLAEDVDATDLAAVRRWAARVERLEAREAIYAALVDAAEVDGLHEAESAFLAVVSEAWQLD